MHRFAHEQRRKQMEEVMKMLGSWLPWANLAAICMLGWSIQRLAESIRSINHDIDYLDRGVERISGVLAKLMRGRKKDQ